MQGRDLYDSEVAPMLNEHRRSGERQTEEIERFKLPALRQSETKVAEKPRILLLSRGGYTKGLKNVAQAREDVELVDVQTALLALSTAQ